MTRFDYIAYTRWADGEHYRHEDRIDGDGWSVMSLARHILDEDDEGRTYRIIRLDLERLSAEDVTRSIADAMFHLFERDWDRKADYCEETNDPIMGSVSGATHPLIADRARRYAEGSFEAAIIPRREWGTLHTGAQGVF